ncbi:dihydrofolate reductase [Pedobacter yulinensis]|uniref:Dihydrofolate reductase n=1 Tax=Pedobacter yulinensis TaxID=2126353 RepID=A0A2T3HJI1_9SPHI|nr:dihydrofolate reductase family protein [Pedobacter yulinensis]PST82606.1 dihydrofolate reductase [Pedobacter yulinensis]
MERKVMLYIAMSLDGYIAKKDDNIDFLGMVERPGEDYGYAAFKAGIDTVIWGRRTFEKVRSFGAEEMMHPDKKLYVISASRTGTEGHAEYHPDPVSLVMDLQAAEGKDIYCDGGAEVVFALLNARLVDRIIVSVIPHLLGSGIRLFKDGLPEQALRLRQSIAFPSGLTQLWFDVLRDSPAATEN